MPLQRRRQVTTRRAALLPLPHHRGSVAPSILIARYFFRCLTIAVAPMAAFLHNYSVVLVWPYRVQRHDDDVYGNASDTRGGGGTRENGARWVELGIKFLSLIFSRGM
jgi:hypothetical protein